MMGMTLYEVAEAMGRYMQDQKKVMGIPMTKSTVDLWPAWKRNYRLTEYSKGNDKQEELPMEKITVEIGFKSYKNCVKEDDVVWLSLVLEISPKRANNLILQMINNNHKTHGSHTIPLAMNYKQLARYTAFRQIDGLNCYWKYPFVLEIQTEPEKPAAIEIRPCFRTVP